MDCVFLLYNIYVIIYYIGLHMLYFIVIFHIYIFVVACQFVCRSYTGLLIPIQIAVSTAQTKITTFCRRNVYSTI